MKEIQHIAKLIVQADRAGILNGCRDYWRQRQQQAGISNRELKQAIEQERQKWQQK